MAAWLFALRPSTKADAALKGRDMGHSCTRVLDDVLQRQNNPTTLLYRGATKEALRSGGKKRAQGAKGRAVVCALPLCLRTRQCRAVQTGAVYGKLSRGCLEDVATQCHIDTRVLLDVLYPMGMQVAVTVTITVVIFSWRSQCHYVSII